MQEQIHETRSTALEWNDPCGLKLSCRLFWDKKRLVASGALQLVKGDLRPRSSFFSLEEQKDEERDYWEKKQGLGSRLRCERLFVTRQWMHKQLSVMSHGERSLLKKLEY